jgi:hypothetical protein
MLSPCAGRDPNEVEGGLKLGGGFREYGGDRGEQNNMAGSKEIKMH